MYSIEEYFRGAWPKLPSLAHPRTGKAFQTEMTPADAPHR